MKKEDYAKELREQWFKTIQEDQRFYIHYSAAGLGLLMTLQALEIGKDAVYGPLPLWIAALLAFVVCLIVNGPVCYYYDARHYQLLSIEMMQNGFVEDDSRMDRKLKIINRTGRASFVIGCLAAVAYFICQRISAAC